MSNYYLAPKPFDSSVKPHQIAGWATEAIQQGLAYLRLQPAYPYIQEGLDLINGVMPKGNLAALSNAKTDLTVRNIKELVAAQTNIRIIPAFATENSDFKDHQAMLNKLYLGWQTATFADRKLRSSWQYACGGGTGYAGIRWEPDYYYKGKGDIVLDAYGPLDVIPIGLPKSHDIQKAYCVAVKVETPYHEVVSKYPEFRDLIKPTQPESKMPGGVMTQAMNLASIALRKFGPGATQQTESKSWATCDVYNLYVRDESVNYSGEPIFMGTPNTTWEYTVPYVGQDIPVGYDLQSNIVYRKARPEDCLIYPNGRLIIVTGGECLNPDPTVQVNPYWHAKVPLVQFRADDWVWNFLGFPLTKAGLSLEKANGEMLRGVVDSINTRLSPPRAYDRNTMARSLAETINTRLPNQVVGLDMSFGNEQLRPLMPAEYYNVPVMVPEFIEQNERRITHQMGVADAQALAQARQLPSGDSMERVMDSMGPLIKDQSRNMESPICALGEMWKSLVFQFYSTARRVQILGPNGEVEEDIDYKPGNLVPDSIVGLPENAPYYLRARHHSGLFTFKVTPYSLHELNSVTRKLFHLQLSRAGFPIDWWTLAEIFDVKNFGARPMIPDPDSPGEMKEATTVFDCWTAQKEIELRFVAAQQQMAAQLQAKAQGGAPGGGGPPPPTPPGPGHQVGRPPSGQNPPSLEQKSDGRSVIRESKH